MATLTAKLWSITPFGMTTSITLTGDAGTSELLIRASTNTAHQWVYQYNNSAGDIWIYKTDEFLHNENGFGEFNPDDIMHVSMVVVKVASLGKHYPPFQAA
jgi:hypothetical protein